MLAGTAGAQANVIPGSFDSIPVGSVAPTNLWNVAQTDYTHTGIILISTFMGAMLVTSKNKTTKWMGVGLLAVAAYTYLNGIGVTYSNDPSQMIGGGNFS